MVKGIPISSITANLVTASEFGKLGVFLGIQFISKGGPGEPYLL